MYICLENCEVGDEIRIILFLQIATSLSSFSNKTSLVEAYVKLMRAVTVVALAGGFHMAGAVCGSLLQLQLYCIIHVVLLVLQ